MKSITRVSLGLALSFAAFMFSYPTAPPVGAIITGLRLQVSAAGPPVAVLWDYDFSLAINRPCPTTVSASCVSGFTEQVTNSAGALVAGPTAVALPATIITTGPTIGISAPFTPPTVMG